MGLALRSSQEHRGQPVPQVLLVDQPEQRAQRDHKAFRERLDQQAQAERLELTERLGRQVQQARREPPERVRLASRPQAACNTTMRVPSVA